MSKDHLSRLRSERVSILLSLKMVLRLCSFVCVPSSMLLRVPFYHSEEHENLDEGARAPSATKCVLSAVFRAPSAAHKIGKNDDFYIFLKIFNQLIRYKILIYKHL